MVNDPNWRLPKVPTFILTSTDFADGDSLPTSARSGIMQAGGEDRSPELSWSGAPEGTKSYALSVYDPDAPTGSGFWHWAVYNIPSSVTSLSADSGNPDANLLPSSAITLDNEAGMARYVGAAPPPAHGEHRYFFTVTALDVDTLDLDDGASPAILGFTMREHVLGRAQLVGVTETPGQ